MLSPSPARMRVGVFGASASGKTTLLASFFGSQQRYDTEKRLGYRLTAANVNDGNLLLRNYYQMQEGSFPPSTALSRARTYEFDLKVSGQVRPAVRIEWIDYPGGWWSEEQPMEQGEDEARRHCILDLLDANVCILLLDGEKFKEEATRSEYLRGEFSQYDREIRRWLTVARATGRAPQSVLKDWIIVLSKADTLGPNYSAEQLHKAVLIHAHKQQERLTELLGSKTAGTGEILRFGTRYMLLSAADADDQHVLSVEKTVGLDLIIPALFKTALVRLASQQKGTAELPPLSDFERLVLAFREVTESEQYGRAAARGDQGLATFFRVLVNAASIPVQQRVLAHQENRQQALTDGNAMEAFARSLDQALDNAEGRRIFHVGQY